MRMICRNMVWVMAALMCTACLPEKELRLTGQTMGTTYQVKIVTGWFQFGTGLQQEIDRRLAAINRSMSTYDPESEISRFNALDTADQLFTISDDFFNVLQAAAELHRLTEGAWDGTLDPLVNLWGFGRSGSVNRVPDEMEVREALKRVGFDRIRLHAGGAISKIDAAVTLDLASIAKGYGVDVIARLIGDKGYSNFLVEIGGEVYARGRRRDGSPWLVGINRPDRSAARDDVYRAVPLSDRAMATSGDYRIFFQIDDHFYSHILDPRTGRPVSNGVVSATVVAANCTVADGLATALMVMGPRTGMALVDRLAGVEALVMVRQPDGTFTDHPSSGFVIQ